MAYVIAEPCKGVKDASCVDVCPVDCIHTSDEDDQYYINPELCIDCAACVDVCPVSAIFHEEDLPQEWRHYVDVNRRWFEEHEVGRGFRQRTERR
ncbi:MAG TPA: 4Fe-4S binding protein [Dehalococcoidia bacterium]|nr:4Fe-4S binding protein [Dehalococcoidia bacterium]